MRALLAVSFFDMAVLSILISFVNNDDILKVYNIVNNRWTPTNHVNLILIKAFKQRNMQAYPQYMNNFI